MASTSFFASYEDGHDLAEYLEAAIDAFEGDRRGYYVDRERDLLGSDAERRVQELVEYIGAHGLPPIEEVRRGRPLAIFWFAEYLAGLLVRTTTELANPWSGGQFADAWGRLATLAQEDDLEEPVNDGMQLAIARHHLTDLRAQVDRSRQLSRLAWDQDLGPPVLRYIRRLSRCYINGFFPECVILCRGVLENAVKQRFLDRSENLPASDGGGSWMKPALRRAEELTWLSKESRKDAWTVWKRANKAVHEDPHATSDALGTIVLTVRVLRNLYLDDA